MSEDKDEIIIDVEGDSAKSGGSSTPKATKQLAPVTKFFIVIFSALLIYHLVSSWMASSKVNDLNEKISSMTKEIGDLNLKVQELEATGTKLSKSLAETETNLKFVDTDRIKKSNEINELNAILDKIQKNIPEGSKMIIQRLEKKLAVWEEYYKNLEETLKSRPDK